MSTPDRMMQFFAYEHLPPHLQEISKPFGELAKQIVETLPSNAERTAGLHKLLEAKVTMVFYAPRCEHDFQGWRDHPDGRGGEQVCAKCGIGAMAWSLRTGI